MNTRQLQYVQTLARVGSFSGAAEELGISQPSLSQYIKKLEMNLGIALFQRTGGALTLTEAGRVYLEAGKRMLEAESQMNARLEDLKQNKTGVLHIGAAPFRTSSILPAAILEFRRRYPGITVRVTEETTAELRAGALRGVFDLCLSTLPVDETVFEFERVVTEELVIAVPASFPVNRSLAAYGGGAVPMAELKDVPFVSVGETQVLGEALTELAQKSGVTLRKAAVCINVDSCLAMAEAGIGAALLPRYLAEGKRTLCLYPVAERTEAREVVVMHRRDAYLSEPIRVMTEILTTLAGGLADRKDEKTR